ncbi:FKBP-type peptidyl-prolyl cis-trans isomerase [uncultured Amnibacterium sp.]|uniref:FKBP-type peptidyl-prolyl cis-trans isomerase n=1 Tax=uncultured Amnibacterium sp. TaxID=1631851 RepID=UPI0035CAA98A
MHLHRRLLPVLAAVSGVALLAGCSSGAAPSATTTPAPSASASAPTAAPLSCASPGTASDAIDVVKSSATEPKVTFPTPTSVTEIQRTVVDKGSGATVKQGDSVTLAYVMYDGKTGKKVDTRGWTESSRVVFPLDTGQVLAGFVGSVVCAKVGDRVASVIPAAQAFGDTGSEQIGVSGGDSIVFVADVLGITPTKADGAAKSLPAAFPKVTLAADGKPTVKIPATDPPTTLKIAESKVGTGTTVKSGDTVTVQYQGVLWRTGAVFDQSWGRSPTSFATTDVVKGFGKALVGAKVGSQVVAIIPPSEGYGSAGQGDIKGTDTMVFVIDVLATARAAK